MQLTTWIWIFQVGVDDGGGVDDRGVDDIGDGGAALIVDGGGPFSTNA